MHPASLSSMITGNILEDGGFRVYGTDTQVEDSMFVRTFPVGPFQCNCSVLGDEETGEALVIDPGDEITEILRVLHDAGLTCRAMFHTHAHLDHVGATAALAKATGAPVLLHEADLPLWEHAPDQAAFMGIESPPMVPVDRYVRDGEFISCGRLRGEVIHTPGHSPGSVCLLVPWDPDGRAVPEPGRLFAGDTLFAGSIGRTDLWGGSEERILQSIRRRLLPLPDETVVIPGHGPLTTIGQERRENPFLT
jgi:hydroxyacylglutathione hydrolase